MNDFIYGQNDMILPTNGIAGPVTPEQMNAPVNPTFVKQSEDGRMLPKPTVSQTMQQIGMALMVADQEGTAAGFQAFNNSENARRQGLKEEREMQRQARRDQLAEY